MARITTCDQRTVPCHPCKDIENIIAHKILGDNFGNVFSFC